VVFAVHEHRPGVGIDDPDHAHSCRQVLLDFVRDFVVCISRRSHFDRQIRGNAAVPVWQFFVLQAAEANERDVGAADFGGRSGVASGFRSGSDFLPPSAIRVLAEPILPSKSLAGNTGPLICKPG